MIDPVLVTSESTLENWIVNLYVLPMSVSLNPVAMKVTLNQWV